MTQGRMPLVAGNWKMNGLRKDAIALARAVVERAMEARCELLVCPPAVSLEAVAGVLEGSRVALGAQDCHFAESGAHTGDVSAAMLRDVGCRYVILGHSERRTDHNETSELVHAKAEAARAAGLVAVVCIGETAEQRDAGGTLSVVGGQLAASVPQGATGENTVIAYEPVWAIGTGRTPTAAEVQEVHAYIRGQLGGRHGEEAGRIRLLYGGSVKPSNAGELLALADVDGALVGGASLKAEDFVAIAKTCP